MNISNKSVSNKQCNLNSSINIFNFVPCRGKSGKTLIFAGNSEAINQRPFAIDYTNRSEL